MAINKEGQEKPIQTLVLVLAQMSFDSSTSSKQHNTTVLTSCIFLLKFHSSPFVNLL